MDRRHSRVLRLCLFFFCIFFCKIGKGTAHLYAVPKRSCFTYCTVTFTFAITPLWV